MDSAQLDAYRDQADRFIAELDEEYYLHYSGQKETLELEEIYERHADLTTTERAREIGEAVDGSARVRELWRFACEGHLGELTRTYEEKLAGMEASLGIDVDGERIPLRNVRPAIANEPDRGRRERLETARCDLLDEHLNPVHAEALQAVHAAVPALGADSYGELYRRFAFPLDETAEQCRAFLEATQAVYEDSVDRLFRRRLGIGLDDARPWDVPRLYRAAEWDSAFPKDAMIPALEATLAGLGIDLRSQRNIHLDVEERPLKRPRAFCSSIEVPGRIMLVIKPMGGPDDWHALFHEAGHAEHFAHTSASLSMEAKRLGDNAVSEGWAMLLEYLVDEPAWQAQRLNMPRADQFAEEGATHLLYIVRRYCAKHLYELELHELDDPAPARARYVELLGDALRIEPMGANYLDDVDDGFYATSYLRAWAFEAQLRSHLLERYGRDWFTQREAGSLLRELWSEGQGYTADEILGEVAGMRIELAAIGDRVAEHVRPG
jgi:oligoendopeptidase F